MPGQLAEFMMQNEIPGAVLQPLPSGCGVVHGSVL